MKSSRYLVLFLFAGLFSCHPQDKVEPQSKWLVNSAVKRSYSSSDLKFYVGLSGIKLDVSRLQSDVTIYVVTYNTTYKGQHIVASGLVAIPATADSVAMVSFQHGTIAAHAEAPSALIGSSEELILYGALASPGLIAAVPDYLGFGAASNQLHPYYVKEATATSVIDLLNAAKELAEIQHLKFNHKLFLAGYSEGGYATMAAHQRIEKDGLPGFHLMASFPAAGGYDVKGVQEYFFGQVHYDEPFFLAYVALAYEREYNWATPLSNFFHEPYATTIPTLFDGTRNGNSIDLQLTDSIAGLVSPDLLANINSDQKFQYIVQAFTENGLTNWKPKTKMFLYHGDEDTTVPYQNSVFTYESLIASGASAELVSLTTFPGKTHLTGLQPYIEDFVPRILSMK